MSLVHPGAYQSDSAAAYTSLGPAAASGSLGPAPVSQQMLDATPLGNQSPGLIMQQRNGWCDCRLGFSIQPYTDGLPAPNSALPPAPLSMWQSGSCCERVCTCTPTFNVYQGDVNIQQMDNEQALQQRLVFSHEKPACVCCPQMLTKDVSGALVGRTIRQCSLCLPSYAVENGIGATVYTVSPEACCLCFPQCNFGGPGACCQIPSEEEEQEREHADEDEHSEFNTRMVGWYIRDPATGARLPNDPHIMHMWTGLQREFCTPNTTVRCRYPAGAAAADKATLLGATLLITLMARQEAKENSQQQ